jgi:stage V sporulation protein SpoVS
MNASPASTDSAGRERPSSALDDFSRFYATTPDSHSSEISDLKFEILSRLSPAHSCREKEMPRRTGVSSSASWLTFVAILAVLVCLLPAKLSAQVSVVTSRNDNSRDALNSNETTLTLANVNTTQFGKLFSYTVDGYVYAQPLYVPNLSIPGKGTHNVLFIVTEHDSVYAFDADSNSGANAQPLWQITLLDAAHGASAGATTVPNGDTASSDIVPEIGITSTPVIDSSSGTIYVVGKTKENGAYFQRLHALDITTGAEKFGGPANLTASVSGNGNGSSGGVLHFDPLWHLQRPGLLLLNGIVYIGFGSHGDMGPWHGWILAYNAATLQQTGVFCSTANGTGSAFWMSGAGLAADVVDPVNHPYGRLFAATGNGSFNAAPPYTDSMSYGDDIIRFDLTNGALTVVDAFTPFNQATLSQDDQDVGAGGVLILPDQTVGGHTHLLIQAGKQGSIYLVDRDNMGGFNASSNNIVQEVDSQIGGLWSTPGFWNNDFYFWGTNDNMKAFSFKNGVLSSGHFSSTDAYSTFPGPTPVVSANGTSNAIVWAIETDPDPGPEILRAYDATNLSNLLYTSSQNLARDNPGNPVKFSVPTVVNGKVYVAGQYVVSIYGLLNGEASAATPVISPASESFVNSVQVSITDSTSGASIFYTTDGSTPSNASTPYTAPFTLTATTTVKAMATAAGFLPSAVAAATYTLETSAATPTFSPAPGTYATAQQVTLADTTSGATIYYTTNGSTPTTSSTKYTGAINVSVTTTIKAIAAATGFLNSAIATGSYTIETPAATPTYSPAPGTYATAQQVTLADTTSGATIYYTTNGSTPTTSSTKYTGAISVSVTTTIKAIAVASGFLNSNVATATYSITPSSTSIDYSAGFTSPNLAMNGAAKLDGARLALTSAVINQAAASYYSTPVNIQSFTTDFTFQLKNGTNPSGEGFTFCIQNSTPSAMGLGGGGLGYGPGTSRGRKGIPKSVAVKFDLVSNQGEGTNSTGLYTNGAAPTVPATSLASSGIDLHSGDTFAVHIVYNGTQLALTITDTVTQKKFAKNFNVDIPTTVGGSSAYVGFTASTSWKTATQEILTWTYTSN